MKKIITESGAFCLTHKLPSAILAGALAVGMVPAAAFATDGQASATATNIELAAQTELLDGAASNYTTVQLLEATDAGSTFAISYNDSTVNYLVSNKEISGASQFTYAGVTYWYKAETATSGIIGTVYGVVPVSANDFYAAAGSNATGYDVISTATQGKASRFSHAVFSNNETTSGTDITAINLPVSVDADTYVRAQLLSGLNVLKDSEGYADAALITEASSTQDGSVVFGTVSSAGVTIDVAKATVVTGATATIATTSAWGDYQIDITDAANGPLTAPESTSGSGSASGSQGSSGSQGGSASGSGSHGVTTQAEGDHSGGGSQGGSQQGGSSQGGSSTTEEAKISSESIVGMTITTNDNKMYSMGFLENIWFKAYELSWYVDGSQTMAKGGTPTNYKQFADIQGKTVTAVTYYTTNGVYEYDLTSSNLFVKYQATDAIKNALNTPESVTLESTGATAAFSSVPSGFTVSTVKFGSGKQATTLTAGDDYTYKADGQGGTLQLTAAGAAKAGENTSMAVTFASDQYADIAVTINVAQPVSFPDVDQSQWYAQYVQQAVDLGIMTGYENGNFGTDDQITRAQAVTVLYRAITGAKASDAYGTDGVFSDVAANTYYTSAVKWAYENGVTTGYGDNTFRPDDKITRADLATMIWRACGQPTATDGGSAYQACKDAGSEGSYATEALKWSASADVMSGSDEADGKHFNPYGNATRAQAAKMFTQSYTSLKK